VVVDEAYHAFSSGGSFIDELDDLPNLVVLRTLSKVGMAGLRVGMMAAGADIVDAVEKVRLPYNINSLSQRAAEIILENRAVVDKQVGLIVKERVRLHDALAATPGVTPFPSETNFILFRVGGASAVFEGLKARGILVRDMDSPGPLSGCLRVTVGTPEQDDEFVAALRELTG